MNIRILIPNAKPSAIMLRRRIILNIMKAVGSDINQILKYTES